MMFNYKKKGEVHTVGECGRLNCLHTWWILPGDVVSFDYGGLFRMPNMRKYMWTPLDFRLYAFFTPAAWVFSEFRTRASTYMRDPFAPMSGDADPFFDAASYSLISNDDNRQEYQWLSGFPANQRLVNYYVSLYNRIWNEWFRDLNYHSILPVDLSDSSLYGSVSATSKSFRDYGRAVCHLPSVYSQLNVNSAEVEDSYNYDVVSNEINMVELQQQAKSIKSVQEYYNMAQRYRDQVQKDFGGSVNHEADPRPYLIEMNKMEFGGHDVDATGDNIGETQGKSTGTLKFKMPETYFGEHGFLQLFAVPRFSAIYANSRNPIDSLILSGRSEDVFAHPEYIASAEPLDVTLADFFNGGSTSSIAKVPAGEFQRWGYNVAHERFHEVESGFPLLDTPDDIHTMIECPPEQWQHMFISKALGQYSIQSMYHMDYNSTLPPSSSSMMSGSNL